MSDMEKIQFGDQVFDLVAGGVDLRDDGGKITFQRGNMSFDDIEGNLQTNGTIRQINTTGEIDWSRVDLAFDGLITQNPNYDIGNGMKVKVLIAKFRLPDVREELKVAQEDLKQTKALANYLSMMTGYDLGGFRL
jgi:hypothetical protein